MFCVIFGLFIGGEGLFFLIVRIMTLLCYSLDMYTR